MTSVVQAIDDFLFHCRYEKNLTDKTIRAYRIDLRQFREFLNMPTGLPPLESMDKLVLRAYLKHMTPLAKPKTIKRKVATLRAFFNYLEFEDKITISPFRKLRIKIVLEDRLPIVMTLADVKRLFRYLYGEKEKITGTLTRKQTLFVRDIAIIELLFATGMRVSELCLLKPEDVDLETGTVKIFGKGRRERMVPICDNRVLKCVAHYQRLFSRSGRKQEPLFITQRGTGITEQSVRILVEKHTSNAGIGKKVTPHTFRHTVATLLLENGMDIRNIQTLLGHSNITTTQIYAKVNSHSQRALLKKMHPRGLI